MKWWDIVLSPCRKKLRFTFSIFFTKMTQSLQNFPQKTENTRLEKVKRAARIGEKARVKETAKDGKVRHAPSKSSVAFNCS